MDLAENQTLYWLMTEADDEQQELAVVAAVSKAVVKCMNPVGTKTFEQVFHFANVLVMDMEMKVRGPEYVYGLIEGVRWVIFEARHIIPDYTAKNMYYSEILERTAHQIILQSARGFHG